MDPPAPEGVAVGEEPGVGGQPAAVGVGIQFGQPGPDPLGVEEVVPDPIEGVGDIDPAAVAADLDHLGAAAQGLVGGGRVGGAAGDAAEADRARLPRAGRVADVVLFELASAPAGDIQPAVIHRQVEVGDQGGTAPKGLRAGGSSSGSAGSAGMVMTLVAAQRSPSRCHRKMDPDRSSTEMTTPTRPQALAGSWAGRSSRTIWWASPRSTRWVRVRWLMLQKLRWWPKRRPSRSWGSRPCSIIEGVPHSEVMTVSWSRCHQPS